MKKEDLMLRQGMRDYAATIARHNTPPPEAQVWLRVQQRRRRAALKQAEQPIRVMQGLAVVCVLVLAAWIAQHAVALPNLLVAKAPLLLAACATITISLAACWTMLRASHGRSMDDSERKA